MSKIVFKDYKDIKQNIDFLLEDENVIVVNKPAHLPVIPDRHGLYNYNLRDLVNKHLKKENPDANLWVVHRIDTDTTGLVILAKNEEYHKKMNDLFEHREIEKSYLAIINGHLPDKEGEINRPILKTSKKMIIHEKGKPSKTQYKVLEEFESYSLVQLKPFTGRTHQLRVHLKSMDCPLMIDPLYSNRDSFYLNQIKKNYHNKQAKLPRPLCSRLTLHAYQLNYIDPLSTQPIELTAPIPKDFMAVLKSLRKYNLQYFHQSVVPVEPEVITENSR